MQHSRNHLQALFSGPAFDTKAKVRYGYKLNPQQRRLPLPLPRSVLPQADLQGRLRQGQRVLHGAGRVLVQARLHRPHLHRVPALPGVRQRVLRETVGMHVSVGVSDAL